MQYESSIYNLFGVFHHQFYVTQPGINGYLRLADDPDDHRAGDSRDMQANHGKEKMNDVKIGESKKESRNG